MSEVKLQIPQPPKEIFHKERTGHVLNEKNVIYLIEKMEGIEGKGILTYYKNVPYPKKGFPTPEAIYALNQIKRMILEFCKLCKNPFFLLGILTTNKTNLLKSFNTVFDKIFGVHKMKDSFMCPASFNFANFVSYVLIDLRIEQETAIEFAFNIAQILEYDDAYRYRFQDIMTELDLELFKKNYKKEIKGLMKILKGRSTDFVFDYKIKPILMPLFLIIPFIKKSLIKNIHLLKKSERDIADWYWMCLRDDAYNYGGMSVEERHAQFTERPEAFEVTA